MDERIARHLEIVFRHAQGSRAGWRESMALARTLEEIAYLGQQRVEDGQVEIAIALLSTLARKIGELFETVHDSAGEIARVVDECIVGLEACISGCIGAPRSAALLAIFDASVWGHDYGVAKEGPRILFERTTEVERAMLAEHVQRRLESDEVHEYRRRFLGRLLIRLRGDDLEEEAQLEVRRQSGDWHGLVDTLLRLHRPKEAAEALAQIQSWAELGRVVELFREHRYVDEAAATLRDLVDERRTIGRWIGLEWLYEHATEAGDERARARWAEELFWEQPGPSRWKLLREALKGSRRTEIRHELEKQEKFELLAAILVSEGKPRWALTQYRRIQPRTPETLALGAKIAEGLASQKPRIAAQLWLDVAEHLVARGHREDYEEAVEFVKLGRDALLAAKHPVLAKRHLEKFRKQHRRRKLLLEALDKAGL